MRKRKGKQILSFLLTFMLALNMFAPSLAAEDIQPVSVEAVEETQAPETQPPETQAPETQAPETQAPETQTPETQAPETQAPETQTPETQALETQAPETQAPDGQEPSGEEIPAPDGQEPATEASAAEGEPSLQETVSEAATEEAAPAAKRTFAQVRFALAELSAEAAEEEYLPARQEEQDDSYLVSLPSDLQAVETIYVKPEPTEADDFVFVKIGEAQAVELSAGQWNALDVRAIDFAAEAAAGTETPVTLQVSDEESWEAAQATRYAVHFQQEAPQMIAEEALTAEAESPAQIKVEMAFTKDGSTTPSADASCLQAVYRSTAHSYTFTFKGENRTEQGYACGTDAPQDTWAWLRVSAEDEKASYYKRGDAEPAALSNGEWLNLSTLWLPGSPEPLDIQIGVDQWDDSAQADRIFFASTAGNSAAPVLDVSATTNRCGWALDDEPQTLQCVVQEYDGNLSYQWYKGEKVVSGSSTSFKQGELIPGATESTFKPADITEPGEYAYYVQVTGQQGDKMPKSASARQVKVYAVRPELKETRQKVKKMIGDYTLDVTLPWSTELLEDPDPSYPTTINIDIIEPAGFTTSSDIMAITFEWYRSDKADFATAQRFESAEFIGNGGGTYTDYLENRVSTEGSNYDVPPTTIPGTTYYFVKAKFLVNGEEKLSKVFGPARVTVKEPEGELPYGVIVGEDPVGYVNLTIADTTKIRTDLKNGMGETITDIGPAGTFLQLTYSPYYCTGNRLYPIYPSDNMMTVFARACLGSGLTQEGAEKDYITKITRKSDGLSRAEFQRGQQSGWMGSLNDWFTGRGFAQYSVANGWLKDGDTIQLLYTTDLGVDLGAPFGQAESYELNNLEVTSCRTNKEWAQLQPAFNKQNDTYEAYSDGSVTVQATAANKQMRVRVFKGEEEYRAGVSIPAVEGDVLKVVVCNANWNPQDTSAENQAMAKVYTVHIIGDSALPTSKVKLTALNEQGEELLRSGVTLYKKVQGSWMGRGGTPPYVYLSGKIGTHAADPAKNPTQVKITLTNLAAGTTASIAPVGEGAALPFEQTEEGLTAVLTDGLAGVGTWIYRIQLQMEGKTIVYWLQLTKSSHALGKLDLNGSPAFSTTRLNGQPEGTLFQVADGEQTGATGFAKDIYEYYMYVTPSVKAIGPKTSSGISAGDLGTGTAALYVGEEKVLEADSISALCKNWYEAFESTVPISQAETRVRLQWISAADSSDEVNYYLHVVQKTYNISELETLINELPIVDALEYARDDSAVGVCETIYASLDEAQKQALSKAAQDKLQAARKMLDAQKVEGEQQIASLLALVDSYKEAVTGETEMTEELYKVHGANIRQSWQDYNLLNGWVAEKFKAEHRTEETAILAAYEVVNRYEISAGSRTDKATNYVHDFMVSANAYNLTLGADEDAYPITFRDIVGEGHPYNSPGRLTYHIEDESIVSIREEEASYHDLGIGGGGTYDDIVYYLMPHQAGTTTLTVTLADGKGTYYGQVPQIIIHVNSPEEAAVEGGADAKLSDFYNQKYTTKYDTWHYFAGTGGAPFTFHVYGQNPQVTVWPVSGGEKKSYTPAADGSVTVYLQDGYNPIEVTATLEGKRLTQVYGLRGKAISYTVENKYRTRQPLRQGDTAVIKLVGVNIPVHKISRIYNPWGGVVWTYDTVGLPGQGALRAETGISQYGTGYLEVLLTGAGQITLTNGRIEEGWIGSKLYEEAEQGNMGGIAGQKEGVFSRLPDIVLNVAAAPEYQQSFRIHPQLSQPGAVRAGEQVSVEIADLPLAEITDKYPFMSSSITTKFQYAQTVFVTNIPGLSEVQSARVDNPGTALAPETALRAIKTVIFTVPEDTPSGTYYLCGGHVNVRHGDQSWTVDNSRMFDLQMDNLAIQVVNPQPGRHTCEWGAGQVIQNPTCVKNGIRAYTCSICGQTKTESIPATGAHSFGAWTKSAPATVFAKEQQTRTCSVCQKTEQRVVGSTLAPTISLNASQVLLKVKQSTTALKVSGLAAGDAVVSWQSANSKIAKVNSSGKITAGKKKGSTTITITLKSGLTKSIKVKVQKSAVKTTKITGLSKNMTLKKGAKVTLKPGIEPITSKQKISYSSSKKSVATVSSKGVIKAKKKGKATITVKSGSKKFKIKVTVK